MVTLLPAVGREVQGRSEKCKGKNAACSLHLLACLAFASLLQLREGTSAGLSLPVNLSCPRSHPGPHLLLLKLPALCPWCARGSPSTPSHPIQGFLMELLREVQPTTFCGIPWVWDRMLDSLKTKHLDSTAFRRRIDRWAMRMGLHTNKRRMMG